MPYTPMSVAAQDLTLAGLADLVDRACTAGVVNDQVVAAVALFVKTDQ